MSTSAKQLCAELRGLPACIPPPKRGDAEHPLSALLVSEPSYTEQEYEALEVVDDDAAAAGKTTIFGLNRLADFVRFRAHAAAVLQHYTSTCRVDFYADGEAVEVGAAARKPQRRADGTLPVLYRAISQYRDHRLLLEAVHVECFVGQAELRFLALDDSRQRRLCVGDLLWVHALDISRHGRGKLGARLGKARVVGREAWRQGWLYSARKAQLVAAAESPAELAYVADVRREPRKDYVVVHVAVAGQRRCFRTTDQRLQYMPGCGEIVSCRPRPPLADAPVVAGRPNSLEAELRLRHICGRLQRAAPSFNSAARTLEPLAPDASLAIQNRLKTLQFAKRHEPMSFGLLTQLFRLGLTMQQNLLDADVDDAVYEVAAVGFEFGGGFVEATLTLLEKAAARGWSVKAHVLVHDDVKGADFVGRIVAIGWHDAALSVTLRFNEDESRLVRAAMGRGANYAGVTTRACHLQLQASAPRSVLLDLDWQRMWRRAVGLPGQTAADNVASLFATTHDEPPASQTQAACSAPDSAPDSYTLGQAPHARVVTLSPEQRCVLRAALHSRSTVAVQAPPGSGRTLLLAAAAIQFALASPEEKMVVLAAVTNNAVGRLAQTLHDLLAHTDAAVPVVRYVADNCLNKVTTAFDIQQCISELPASCRAQMAESDVRACEVYTASRPLVQKLTTDAADLSWEQVENGELAMLRDEDRSPLAALLLHCVMRQRRPRIFLATTASLLSLWREGAPLHELAPAVAKVFVAEANGVSEPTMMATMLLFGAADFVLAGDRRQLPPHARAGATRLAHASALDAAWAAPRLRRLALGAVFDAHPALTQRVYEGALRSCATSARDLLTRRARALRLPESPAVFVAMRRGLARRSAEASCSLTNEFEAGVAALLLERLLAAGVAPHALALVCYYKAQAQLLRERHPRLRVLTVEASQSLRFELALVLTTTTAAHRFLADERRACVALSRAKQGLVVLGSAHVFRRLQATSPLRRFYEACERAHDVVDADQLLPR